MLELRQDGVPLQQVQEGGWFKLPNGDVVSPATLGWKEGSFELFLVGPPPPQSEEEVLEQRRAAMGLSFSQLLIGLVTEQWITEEDGRAWLKGILPSAVEDVIASLPEGQRFKATARATAPSYVSRIDPLVVALGAAQQKTEGQIDAFFTTYANV